MGGTLSWLEPENAEFVTSSAGCWFHVVAILVGHLIRPAF